MNNNNNNNTNVDIGMFITLLEIWRSRQKEHESDELTNSLICALANEVQKLHEENDIIMEQNEKILKKLQKIERRIING